MIFLNRKLNQFYLYTKGLSKMFEPEESFIIDKENHAKTTKYLDRIKLHSDKKLYQYQRDVAKTCIDIEFCNGKRIRGDFTIQSPGMIINMPVGTGKTLTACVYLRSMIHNTDKVLSYTQMQFESNLTTCVSHEIIRNVNIDTLILCSPTIIEQWAATLEDCGIRYTIITIPSDFKMHDLLLKRTVLVSTSHFKAFVQYMNIQCVYRFIYDEPDTCYVAGIHIECKFAIVITGTPEQLFLARKKNAHDHTIRKIFGDIDKSFLYTCDPNDIKIAEVKVDTIVHRCLSLNSLLYKNVVDYDVMNALQCGDEKMAMELLSVPEKKCINLYESVIAKLDYDEVKYKKYDTEHAKKMLVEIKTKRTHVEARNKKLINLYDTKCNSCFFNDIMYVCICGTRLCETCIPEKCLECEERIKKGIIFKNIFRKENRALAEGKLAWIIMSYMSISKTTSANNYVGEVCNIIFNKSQGKFLVFSYYDVSAMVSIFEEHKTRYGIIEGRVSVRTRLIENFKSGHLNVLIFKDRENMAGTDIPEATDIILSHSMNIEMEEQCIARAKRIGCDHPITVHKFQVYAIDL